MKPEALVEQSFNSIRGEIVSLRERRSSTGRSPDLHLDLLEGFEENQVGMLLHEAMTLGKLPINALYTLFAGVRYLAEGEITEMGSQDFSLFVTDHYGELSTILQERNVSTNIPQRALPILAAIDEAHVVEPIKVVELGSSAGLIGRALIQNAYFLDNLDRYALLSPEFKDYLVRNPVAGHSVNTYVGVDIDRVDDAWALACLDEPDFRPSLEAFIHDVPRTRSEKIIQADALDFDQLPEILQLDQVEGVLLLMTSVMMYQLPTELLTVLNRKIDAYLTARDGLRYSMEYDSTSRLFTGELVGYGERREHVGPYIFTSSKTAEWRTT
jgi:hypothetical protein